MSEEQTKLPEAKIIFTLSNHKAVLIDIIADELINLDGFAAMIYMITSGGLDSAIAEKLSENPQFQSIIDGWETLNKKYPKDKIVIKASQVFNKR